MTVHRLTLIAAALIALTAGSAQAACFAEYKAKRDRPFELHYSVAQIQGPCTRQSARRQLVRQLGAQGLTLLKILSVREG